MYEAFISFKNLTEDRKTQTRDSEIAAQLYEKLTQAGVNAFFSNVEIQRKGDPRWGSMIDNALSESKVIIVVGTRKEYVNSEWVEYEWRYFSEQIRNKADKRMITVLEGISTYQLGPAFQNTENYRPNELDKAVDMVLKILKKAPPAPVPAAVKTELPKQQTPEITKTEKTTVEAKAPAEAKTVKTDVSIEVVQKNSDIIPIKVSEANEALVKTKTIDFKAIAPLLIFIFLAVGVSVWIGGAFDPYKDLKAELDSAGFEHTISGDEITITGYNGNNSTVVIPYGVTSIGAKAFYNCNKLTSITIPNSINDIGHSAFWNCDNLTLVSIPNSVTDIGVEAFYSCDKLMSISIPHSVTSIGTKAFYSCDSLSSITIPNSVLYIGADAFSGCKLLTITCSSDSVAYRYALNNNIPVKIDNSL